jgi:hypothetical protein
MPVFDPRVTAMDAAQGLQNKLAVARVRRVPKMLEQVRRLQQSETYHIFNVGPWPQVVNTGSTGTFYIPGCPSDKPYVEMTVTIPSIVEELIIKDETEFAALIDDGWEHFALEIVGDGRGMNPEHSLRNFGIFPSKTDIPMEGDIAEATKRLQAKCAMYVREARDLYQTDRKRFSQVVRPEVHFRAAEVLNLTDEDWMTKSTPSAKNKCMFCGTMNDEIAVKCHKCNEIIDIERYRALKAAQEDHSEVKRGVGRPRNPESN